MAATIWLVDEKTNEQRKTLYVWPSTVQEGLILSVQEVVSLESVDEIKFGTPYRLGSAEGTVLANDIFGSPIKNDAFAKFLGERATLRVQGNKVDEVRQLRDRLLALCGHAPIILEAKAA